MRRISCLALAGVLVGGCGQEQEPAQPNALDVRAELRNGYLVVKYPSLGGTLSREASSTVGPLAEQTLANLAVQKVFLGTEALDLESGLTDTTLEIAQVKRAMITAAKQVFLLADSSKWDQTGFIKVAQLQEIDALISDENFPASARMAVERLGIRLILV